MFLVTTIGAGLAVGSAGGAALRAPLARHVFEAPFTSGLQDARVQITTHDGTSPDVVAEGVMVFSPSRASQLQARTEADPVPHLETIDAHGVTYTRTRDPAPTPGLASRWTADPVPSPAFQGTGWSASDPPDHLRITGLESVGADRAWHLTASDGGQWWIRAWDGYPLKLVRERGLVTVTYLFGQFNARRTVEPPPDGQVSTRLVNGRVGDALVGPSALARVTQVEEGAAGWDRLAPVGLGQGHVAAHLFLSNMSAETMTFGVVSATDTRGLSFSGVPTGTSPADAGRVKFAPGQSVDSWVTFDMLPGTQGLTLRIWAPASQSGADCVFSIPLTDHGPGPGADWVSGRIAHPRFGDW